MLRELQVLGSARPMEKAYTVMSVVRCCHEVVATCSGPGADADYRSAYTGELDSDEAHDHFTEVKQKHLVFLKDIKIKYMIYFVSPLKRWHICTSVAACSEPFRRTSMTLQQRAVLRQD